MQAKPLKSYSRVAGYSPSINLHIDLSELDKRVYL
jgi:hypothetical protein